MKKIVPKRGIFINKIGDSWYWHLKSRNGRIIAHGRAFNTKRSTIHSINTVAKYFKYGNSVLRTAYDLSAKELIWL